MSLKENAHICETPSGANVTLQGNSSSVLVGWEIKAHAHPVIFMDAGMAVLGFIPLICFLYGCFFS
jgi:hypothetical protein